MPKKCLNAITKRRRCRVGDVKQPDNQFVDKNPNVKKPTETCLTCREYAALTKTQRDKKRGMRKVYTIPFENDPASQGKWLTWMRDITKDSRQ